MKISQITFDVCNSHQLIIGKIHAIKRKMYYLYINYDKACLLSNQFDFIDLDFKRLIRSYQMLRNNAFLLFYFFHSLLPIASAELRNKWNPQSRLPHGFGPWFLDKFWSRLRNRKAMRNLEKQKQDFWSFEFFFNNLSILLITCIFYYFCNLLYLLPSLYFNHVT